MDLQDRIEILEEENRLLHEELAPKMELPDEWGLTWNEAVMFRAMSTGRWCSSWAFALANDKRVTAEYISDNSCKVLICRIRKKLAPYDIEIVTKYNFGWQIPGGWSPE